ncbi:MAG TPA: C25 family cysteine peptidase [bacterium]|nr:C25 family cysteine peptidase [bacterium]HPR87879.1 C25 family cysteine peptidase [bacterium]
MMRRKTRYGLNGLIRGVPGLLLVWLQITATAADQPYRCTVVESSDRALVCDVVFDSVQVSQTLSGGQWITEVALPGASYTDQYNLPRLPLTSLVLGAPASGSARLTLISEESTTRSAGSLRLADKPLYPLTDSEGREKETLPLAALQEWYPAQTAELGLDGQFRSQRLVQVYLRPVRYASRTQTLQIVHKLRLRLDFTAEAGASALALAAAAPVEPAACEQLLRATLGNYEASKNWRSAGSAPAALARTAAATATRLRIEIRDDGVYIITGKELAAAGINLAAINPNALALSHRGKNVALLVEGGSDGTFDAQDRILFIGRHNSAETFYYSQYSDNAVYWLSWDGEVGARFAETPASPPQNASDTLSSGQFRIHLEHDLLYERTLDNSDATLDHWYWASASSDYDFTVPLPIAHLVAGQPLQISVNMLGLTHIYQANPDHHVRLYLNDQLVDEAYWDNQTAITRTQTITEPKILSENNTLRFKLPLDLKNVSIDKILVNYVDLQFTGRLVADNDSLRVLLPAGGQRLVRLDGFSSDQIYAFTEEGQIFTGYQMQQRGGGWSCYLGYQAEAPRNLYVVGSSRLMPVASLTLDTPSDLRNPANGADYIIITHADFASQAQRLAQHRAAEGLRTAVVDVQDIYDEFNDGIYDPNALRDFIAYAYYNWTAPAPLYVLLFGTTTHYMDKQAGKTLGLKSFIPTLMVYTNSWGMTSSDNALVSVSGSDILPDLYVGRFPVSDAESANTVVQKTLDYEQQPAIDEWRRNVGLVYAEGDGGRFIRDANELISKYTPSRVVVNRLTTLQGSAYYGNTETLAEMINSGQSLVNFIGHGGGGVYFDNELFKIEDVKRLNNKNRYPVVFSMTCFVGHFDNPEMPSLGMQLVLAKDRGAVAHFGSAAKASADGDYYLDIALFNAIFAENARRMGEIITLGKLLLIQKTNGYWDNVRHFVLLGDPGLNYHISDAAVTIQPAKSAWLAGETIQVSGRADAITQGTAVVTLANEADSVVARKVVAIQNGAWQCDLMTLTAANLGLWSTGKATARVFAYDSQHDAAAAVALSVAGHALVEIRTDPVAPMHQEPYYFSVTVDVSALANRGGVAGVSLNLSANSVEWQSVALERQSDGTWRTSAARKQNEGSRIYYQSVVTAGNGDKIVGEICSTLVGYRPDLSIDPTSVKIGGTPARIEFRLKNSGDKPAANFTIAVTEGVNASTYKPVADRLKVTTIPGNSDTLLSVLWNAPNAGERKFWFQSDADNQVEESNEGNNVTLATARVITAAAGTGGPLYLPESNGYIDIPAGAISQTTTLTWRQGWDDTQARAATWSGLLPVKFRFSTGYMLYGCTLADTSLRVTKEISVVALFDPQDAQNQLLVRNQSLRIYGWNARTSTWSGLKSVVDSTQGTITAALPASLQAFSLLASQDAEAPVITLSVGGQNFADGDAVSRTPVFTAYMEDASGFDLGGSGIHLTLDHQAVEAGAYTLFQSTDARRSLTLTFAPTLETGAHTLALEVADINGNPASIEAQFHVEGLFALVSLANHPNPFQEQTTIAFNLSETASRIRIGIYTVSGRLLRTFELQGVTGYGELDWDGTDADGNTVANGVYYLKFVAEQGGKRIERIEKMAKLQ